MKKNNEITYKTIYKMIKKGEDMKNIKHALKDLRKVLEVQRSLDSL